MVELRLVGESDDSQNEAPVESAVLLCSARDASDDGALKAINFLIRNGAKIEAMTATRVGELYQTVLRFEASTEDMQRILSSYETELASVTHLGIAPRIARIQQTSSGYGSGYMVRLLSRQKSASQSEHAFAELLRITQRHGDIYQCISYTAKQGALKDNPVRIVHTRAYIPDVGSLGSLQAELESLEEAWVIELSVAEV